MLQIFSYIKKQTFMLHILVLYTIVGDVFII